MSAKRPWPNEALWALEDTLTLAAQIRKDLRPIMDADDKPITTVEIVRRAGKAIEHAAEIEIKLQRVRS